MMYYIILFYDVRVHIVYIFQLVDTFKRESS